MFYEFVLKTLNLYEVDLLSHFVTRPSLTLYRPQLCASGHFVWYSFLCKGYYYLVIVVVIVSVYSYAAGGLYSSYNINTDTLGNELCCRYRHR